MEEEQDEAAMNIPSDNHLWPAVEPEALSPNAAQKIAEALVNAKSPLIITSRLPKDSATALSNLSSQLAIPIFFACPTVASIPLSFENVVGVSYLNGGTNCALLPDADVILIVDCDVPWLVVNGGADGENLSLKADSRVFIVDSQDPLKTAMGNWHIPAEMICRAECSIALTQIGHQAANLVDGLQIPVIQQREPYVKELHDTWVERLKVSEGDFSGDSFKDANILGALRIELGRLDMLGKTLVLNEGISAYASTWAHLLAIDGEQGLDMITSGGSSLGWGLPASVGAMLGLAASGAGEKLTVAIVGDGSFLFGVPSSSFWIARRYETPFLTIILNNAGWRSPKLSMLGVHPSGIGAPIPGHELTVGFGPHVPDYAGIAVAATAGWAYGKKVRAADGTKGLEEGVREAIHAVLVERRCAVLDCELKSI